MCLPLRHIPYGLCTGQGTLWVSLPWCHCFLFTVIFSSLGCIIHNLHHCLTVPSWIFDKACVANQTCVAPGRTDCLHTAQSVPFRKVKKSWLPPCSTGIPPGSTTVSSDGICRSPRLRVGPWQAAGTSDPPKDSKMSPSSTTAPSPSRHCSMAASTYVRGSMHCETLCREGTSKRALAASLRATSTPCPFTHCRKGGRL